MRFPCLLLLLCAGVSWAGEVAPLPKVAPWSGRSRELVRPVTDPWITPAEASGFQETPSYEQ